MNIDISHLKSICEKLNGINKNINNPLIWSIKVHGAEISLLQYDEKRGLTQAILSGHSAKESYLFLQGYYLGLRNLSMSV